MSYQSADELILAADNLYEAQKYQEAADLLETHWLKFPADKTMLIYWMMSMKILAEQYTSAVDYFKLLIEADLWFAPGFLEDTAFDALRDIPEFQRLAKISLERYTVAQQNAQPELFIETASDEPLPAIIMCHGDGENAGNNKPYWASAVENGWWVAYAQSSQLAGVNLFAWTDNDLGVVEMKAHYVHLKERGMRDDHVIVAGYSRGGRIALYSAIRNSFPIKGVIVVASALPPNIDTLDLSQLATDVAFYILFGELQLQNRPHYHRLAERLKEHGNRVMVDERAGLALEYPDDFAETLLKALAFIDGKDMD